MLLVICELFLKAFAIKIFKVVLKNSIFFTELPALILPV